MARTSRKPLTQQRKVRCREAPAISISWQDGPLSAAWTEMWKRILRDPQADDAGDDHSDELEKRR